MDERELVEYAITLDRGTGIRSSLDGVVENNMLASYSHLHAASYRGFPSNFLLTCTRAK
jgi:cobyrinic acid a,c-diamide synthase